MQQQSFGYGPPPPYQPQQQPPAQQQQYGASGPPSYGHQQQPPQQPQQQQQHYGQQQQQQPPQYGGGYQQPAAYGGAGAPPQQPQQLPFVPSPPPSQQPSAPHSPYQQQHQAYQQQAAAYGGGAGGFMMPGVGGAPQPMMPGLDAAAAGFGISGLAAAATAAAAAPAAAGGFMGGLSPLGLMSAGGLLAAPQQFMQSRVGWLKTNMTGGTMSALFNISNAYVSSKLLMLALPFLKRWTYARHQEQIAGGQRYRPPAVDVNAPDLFIPLMAAWSYALLSCVVLALRGTFAPDAMSSTLYSACLAWGVHWLVARLTLRGMGVASVPWSELLAYTGYPFVGVCATTLAGFLAGRWGYYAVGAYCALATAVFMVKTMKRVLFQEARAYGADVRTANYLLLGLAAFQVPFNFFMAYRAK